MAKVGRFYGAVLVESQGDFYIVGDLKVPADYAGAGFADPGELRPLQNRFVRLAVTGEPAVQPPYLTCELEGESLAEKLFHRLVIKRNGSVSERLWNLIFDTAGQQEQEMIEADWLVQMPDEMWEIIQDQVLRCR